MADRGGDVDDALTTMAQAWIGGVVAWQRTWTRIWSGFQEGAFEETVVPGGEDNEDCIPVFGPSGPLHVTHLYHASRPDLRHLASIDAVKDPDDHRFVIGSTHIGLSRQCLPAGTSELTVTVFDVPPGQVPGSYVGRVVDTASWRIVTPINPFVAPAAPG